MSCSYCIEKTSLLNAMIREGVVMMVNNQQGTAHRPSQADQEYVLNSKGEKVRNTAFRGG